MREETINRDSISLKAYFKDLRKLELIDGNAQTELAIKAKEGDQDAMRKLVESNLRFVCSVAKEYSYTGIPLEDLIQEGNLGIIKAVDRFDATKGYKFISYAVWWIRQSILQALAEQSRIVRLPLNQVGSLNKIKKASSKLEQEFQRPPSSDEIAHELDVSETKIDSAMRISTRYVSMDAPLLSDDETSLIDVFVPNDATDTDDELIRESLRREIDRSLSTLSEKERDVINLYYGIGMPHGLTLEEIGAKFDLTRERVRQIKEKAIRRLRHTSRSKLLKSYLG